MTGLFGGNSSGKSSILQFLLMLKQTKNASDRSVVLHFGDRDRGDFVELGGFRDIVHRNDSSRTISWALEWGHDHVTIGDPQGSRRETLYDFDSLLTECAVHMYSGDIRPYMLRYVFESGSFSVMADQDSPKYALDGGDYSFLRNQGRPWGLPGPVKTHLFPDQAKTYYQNTGFLGVFETEYERLMDRITTSDRSERFRDASTSGPVLALTTQGFVASERLRPYCLRPRRARPGIWHDTSTVKNFRR